MFVCIIQNVVVVCVVYVLLGCGVRVCAGELLSVTRGKVVVRGSSLIGGVVCDEALSRSVGLMRG